jgi:hypothetical protein
MLHSTTFHLGMDVHKGSIAVAVFRNAYVNPRPWSGFPMI